MKRLVTFGGGKGQPELLRGLVQYPVHISAVVSMMDNGGSSGVLREQEHVLPPGDLRRCIAALADDESAVLAQWEKRDDADHAAGNLALVEKTKELGDMQKAADFFLHEFAPLRFAHAKDAQQNNEQTVEAICVTLEESHITAKFSDGTTAFGETEIDEWEQSERAKNAILESIKLSPVPAVNPRVVEAIHAADAIILSMGDVYSSVIPNVLVEGVTQAIAEAKVPVIAVCNRTTKQGESHNFTTADFARVFEQYIQPASLHAMIADNFTLPVPEGFQPTRVMPLENSHIAFVTADIADAQKPQAVSGMLAAKEIMKLFE